ncbi:hypothetical protein [Bacillus smithii]|uniref:hypothetical protein n=1 Tax=Bacillus smithii TaxID=1479 RepID=UPI002E1F37C8|nr:hypothetical protein [Bacillus smithii]MED4927939.1 hypothetical protein [Bacillus smithii]
MLAAWLSEGDRARFQWLMFLVFLHLGILVAKKFIPSNKNVILVTISSLTAFVLIQYALDIVFQTPFTL